MRLIDADLLQTALMDEYVGIAGYNTRAQFYRAIEIVQQQPTITQPPNAPLPLEELREMDGEPVWIEWGGHPQAGWALVRVWSKASNVVYLTYHNGNTDLLGFVLNDGGKIYRRRPEEG